MTGVTMRRSLGEAVKIDQGMLRYVLDQSRDCIKILDSDGVINYVNSAGQCALEIADLSTVLGRPWPQFWPEQSRSIVEAALEKAKIGQDSEIEASRPDSRGQLRWWHVSVSPLLEESGELAGILTLSRDVTPHVTLRESDHTLALEMRHRLRNAYTIASAIVMQSARDSAADSQAFAELVCARLADVALSQTRLLDAGAQSWLVADLVRTLVAAHGQGALQIRFAGQADATVDGHQAMLIALVVGELTNNSLKYGALRNRNSVSLSWTIDAGLLTLHWRESIGDDDADALRPRSDESGYSMMKRMARAQRATFEYWVADGELRISLALAAKPA